MLDGQKATTTGFLGRIVGAVRLDPRVYEEVEHDTRTTLEAIVVVTASSIATGVGARGFGGRSDDVWFFAVISMAAWAAWVALTYRVGIRLLPESQTYATPGQMIRTLGFATAPGLFRVAGVWPSLTLPVFAVTSIWMLMATIVALQRALDYRHTARAVTVCVVAWALIMAIAVAIAVVFTPAAY
jgi:hypothetical protein